MTKKDLTREELIKLLQQQDEDMKALAREEELRAQQAQTLEIELLKKQKEIDDKLMLQRKIEEQRNVNLLQKYASEATIYKGEIEKSSTEMEEIDRQLLSLIEDTKKRVNKLANQFIDLNKEKNNLLTQNELDIKNDVSEDLRMLQRTYAASLSRNQRIIDSEITKEMSTQRNVDLLTKTIDLSLLDKEDQE